MPLKHKWPKIAVETQVAFPWTPWNFKYTIMGSYFTVKSMVLMNISENYRIHAVSSQINENVCKLAVSRQKIMKTNIL